MPPTGNVVSPVVLADLLEVRLDRLADIILFKGSLYRPYEQRRGAKVRAIDRPVDPLKQIQKRIYTRFLRDYPFPPYVYAGRPGHSIFTAASPHVRQPVVVTVDLESFYPSISQSIVYHVWREVFGCGRDVARLLAELTTYCGHLPQGAPTSLALANLVMAPADLEIALQLSLLGRKVNYSRWVDDLIISGHLAQPRGIFDIVAQAIRPLGLRINRRKAKKGIMPHTRRQTALGLLLNEKMTIAREKRGQLRAAVDAFQRFRRGRLVSIMGRLEFLKSCHPSTASILLRRLMRQADKSARTEVSGDA